MSITRKTGLLLCAMLSIVILPWLGSYIYYSGNFPEGFFNYPMLEPLPKAPFSWMVFIVVAVAFIGVATVYLLPTFFGFKKVPYVARDKVIRVKFPIWFWLGLIAWGYALVLLWTKSMTPIWFLHWSDLPLFWGFVLVMDGIVYKRTGGNSMISQRPQELLGIGVASAGGWMLFEYLNFFVNDDWFYPWGDIIDREVFLLYAIVISSGLLPLAFQWYDFLNTFPAIRVRYTDGIKITLPRWIKWILLIVAIFGLIGSGLFPDYLFFSLWISPVLLLILVLDLTGRWTPLKSISHGNWGPTMLFALTYLIQGLLLEGQNYFSAIHEGDQIVFTEAPAYWQYNLPFVNRFHLFEMPILGYLGYLPFGLYCWIWWIAFAKLLGIPSKFYREEPFESVTAA